MKEIKLTKGKIALVDDEDYEYLNKFKWQAYKKYNNCYAGRALSRRLNNGKQKTIFMHREILSLEVGNIQADHIDHNGLNNQRSNLRVATPSQNTFNRRSHSGASSKYKGVQHHKAKYKDTVYYYWKAVIGINGKVFHIGVFKSENDAALAYNQKAVELHGEFANLNIIPNAV